MSAASGGSTSVRTTGYAAGVLVAPVNGGTTPASGGAGPAFIPGMAVPGFADPASPGS